MDTAINYMALAHALNRYSNHLGYIQIDVPWIVPNHVTRMTLDPQYPAIEAYEGITVRGYGGKSIGDLVGSAEQSFLTLDTEGVLGRGKFVSITPCFRMEQAHNDFTRPYFMKVELYQNTDVTRDNLNKMIGDALYVFRWLISQESSPELNLLETKEIDDGYDIMLNGVEIGSYGIRHKNGLSWIYGTGLAEPRFSVAKL